MSKQAVITAKYLRNLGACDEQVELFEEVWGPSVVVTEEEMVKHAHQFDWSFGAEWLLAPRDEERQVRQDRYSEWRGLLVPLEDQRREDLGILRRSRDNADNDEAYSIATSKVSEATFKWDDALRAARARAFAQLYIKYNSEENADGTAKPAESAVAGVTAGADNRNEENSPVEVARTDEDSNDEPDESDDNELDVDDSRSDPSGTDDSSRDSPAPADDADSESHLRD